MRVHRPILAAVSMGFVVTSVLGLAACSQDGSSAQESAANISSSGQLAADDASDLGGGDAPTDLPQGTEDFPFVVVESGSQFASLQEAIDAIGNGKGSISALPGTYTMCAEQYAGDITYRSSVPGGKVVLADELCADKGGLVLAGAGAVVDGFGFTGMFNEDNGAGIRHQDGNLVVRNSAFSDSQNGILSGVAPEDAAEYAAYIQTTMTIENSTFETIGFCTPDEYCAHSLYIGNVAKLTVKDSTFSAGTGGHYIKYRGPQAEIRGNTFDDTDGDYTNYMIDFPNGSSGIVTGNAMIQGAVKDNGNGLIVVGAEQGYTSLPDNPSDGLRVEANSVKLAPGAEDTTLVVNYSADQVQLGTNQLPAGVSVLADMSE